MGLSKKKLAIKEAVEQGYAILDGQFVNVKTGTKLVLGGFDKDGFPTICIRFKDSQAIVRVKDIAAYQKFGDKFLGSEYEVSHVNGDVCNFNNENLRLDTVFSEPEQPNINNNKISQLSNEDIRQIFLLCQEYGNNPLPSDFKFLIFDKYGLTPEELEKINLKLVRPNAFGKKTISLDCGAHFGFAVTYGDKISKKLNLIESGFVYFGTDYDLGQRQESYTNWLENLILVQQPDLIVVEEVNRVFSGLHNKKNENSWLLYWLYGEVVRLSAKHHLPLLQINPISLKSCVTGNGRAKKNEVIDSVKKYFPELPSKLRSDTADAIALAITHWRMYNNEYTVGAKKKNAR